MTDENNLEHLQIRTNVDLTGTGEVGTIPLEEASTIQVVQPSSSEVQPLPLPETSSSIQLVQPSKQPSTVQPSIQPSTQPSIELSNQAVNQQASNMQLLIDHAFVDLQHLCKNKTFDISNVILIAH